MLRGVFRIGCGLSLVVCLLLCALLVRSFWADDSAQSNTHFPSGTVQYTIETIRGTIEFRISRIPGIHPSNGEWLAMLPLRWHLSTDIPANQPAYPQALWAFQTEYAGVGLTGQDLGRVGVYFPMWLLILASAIPPALLWLLRKRRRGGFCITCGYDLRATPDRCPECGTPIKVADNGYTF